MTIAQAFWIILLLAIANVMLIGFAVVSGRLRAHFERAYIDLKAHKLAHFNQHLEIISGILEQRTGFTNYIYALQSSDQDLEDEIFQEIETYIQFCLEQTKNIFEIETGERCSTTIKLIVLDDEYDNSDDFSIMTFSRDRASHIERQVTDDIVPSVQTNEHTPFERILSGKVGFVENDLRSLAKNGQYKNSNPNWKNYYNATCVVPISRPYDDTTGNQSEYRVLGFLCVDSMNGQFNPSFSIAMLKIISHSLYYTFDTIMQLKSLHSSDLEEEASID